MKTLKSVLQNIAGILQTVYSFFMLLGGGWLLLVFILVIRCWTFESVLWLLFSFFTLGIGIFSAILADNLIGGYKIPDEALQEEIAPPKRGNVQGDAEQPQKEIIPSREKSEPFQEEVKQNNGVAKKSIALIVLNVVYVLATLLISWSDIIPMSPKLCFLLAIPSSIVILLTAVSLILPSDSPKSN